MFNNYLKISLRHLLKNKSYSLINLIGFSIGLAAVLLISMYGYHEYRFDRHYKDGNRIFRLVNEYGSQRYSLFMKNKLNYEVVYDYSAYGSRKLLNQYPDVEVKANVYNNPDDPAAIMIKNGDGDSFYHEKNIFICDPEIFQIFDWHFIKGNSETALTEPFNAVFTEEKAKKYFGKEDPIGKEVTIKFKGQAFILKVVAIIENIPYYSHFRPEIICSLLILHGDPYWESYSACYLKLKQHISYKDFEKKLKSSIDLSKRSKIKGYHLQPLREIHFSDLPVTRDFGEHGNIENLFILSTIALLILLIASINFVLLSTAKSVTRTKEIGIRKVIGAHRSTIIKQLLGESILITIISLPIAFLLIELLLPFFNTYVNAQLSVSILFQSEFILFLLCITIIIGVVAGSYVAFYMSSFKPVEMLTGARVFGKSKSNFRKGLIIFQLSAFIVLSIFTIFVFLQLKHVQSKNTLGYEKDNLLFIDIHDQSFTKNYKIYKTNILNNSSVINVSASSSKLPGAPTISRVSGSSGGFEFIQYYVDYDYFETVGIQFVAGRAFSFDFPSDNTNSLILNETALNALGDLELLGTPIGWGERNLIGVVNDFHVESLYKKIEPTVFTLHLTAEYFRQIVIRINSTDIQNTISFLENEWNKLSPQFSFEFKFADDTIQHMYNNEQNIGRIIGIAAFLAVFILCLGLLGLCAFLIEQRTKEISIRKVLGASVPNIIRLIFLDFVYIVIFANIIAWPIAYYSIIKYLHNFAYQIDFTIWPYAFAGGLTLLIILLTVLLQTIRVASMNPVDNLANE